MKDRLKKIKKILMDQKQIEVIGLSELLEVSDVTIRRNLDKLEKEGFLKKTYGGAIYLGSGPTSLTIARYLKKSNLKLTVLTNDILVAVELFNKSTI